MAVFMVTADSDLEPGFLDFAVKLQDHLQLNFNIEKAPVLDMLYDLGKNKGVIVDYLEDNEFDPRYVRTLLYGTLVDNQVVEGTRQSTSNVYHEFAVNDDLVYHNYEEIEDALFHGGIAAIYQSFAVKDDVSRKMMTMLNYRDLTYSDGLLREEEPWKYNILDYLGAAMRSQCLDDLNHHNYNDVNIPSELEALVAKDFFTQSISVQHRAIELALNTLNDLDAQAFGASDISEFDIFALADNWPIEYARTRIVCGDEVGAVINQVTPMIDLLFEREGVCITARNCLVEDAIKRILFPFPAEFKAYFKELNIEQALSFPGTYPAEVEADHAQRLNYSTLLLFLNCSSLLARGHSLLNNLNSMGYKAEPHHLIPLFILDTRGFSDLLDLASEHDHDFIQEVFKQWIALPEVIRKARSGSVEILNKARFIGDHDFQRGINKEVMNHIVITNNFRESLRQGSKISFCTSELKEDFIKDLLSSNNLNNVNVLQASQLCFDDLRQHANKMSTGTKQLLFCNDLNI